jgi:methionyl aminopeptidase
MRLDEGLVIAIEPMFNAGSAQVRTLPDRWTVVTADRALSAHFEHTIAVTATGPVILTG